MWRLVKNDGVEVLRQAYSLEHEADKQKISVERNEKCRSVRPSLIKNYENIYKQYLRGLEMLNYARHVAQDEHMDGPESDNAREIATFCGEQMNTYMDRCINILHKLESILIPIEYVDNMMKDGYVAGNTVYFRDGAQEPLTMSKNSIDETRILSRGTYRLVVKYLDSYSIAAPTVKIGLEVQSENDPGSFVINSRGAVMCQYAWRRDFGVWNSARVHFTVHSSGMRDAHVSVVLQEWIANDPLNYVGPRPPTPPPPISLFQLPLTTSSSSSYNNINTVLFENNNNNDTTYNPNVNYNTQGYNTQPTAPNATANNYYNNNSNNNNNVAPLDDAYLAALAAYTNDNNNNNNYNYYGNNITQVQPPTQINVPHRVSSHLDTPENNDTNDNTNNGVNENSNNNNAAGNISAGCTVEVNPANMTCAERERRLRQILNSWPHDGVTAVALPSGTTRELQKLHSLPFPHDINGNE